MHLFLPARRQLGRLALVSALSSLFCHSALAAAPVTESPLVVRGDNIAVPHVERSAVIDGVLDDGIWDSATRVPLNYETRPRENVPPTVTTDAYLVEDGRTLYIAFVASDPRPEEIRAFMRGRDSAYADDFVGVTLDTFNDQRRAFEFFANPLGVQMDLINDDVNGNEDDSWNATWDSAGEIGEDGYVVEMAIPLNILRFQGGLKTQVWGVDLLRFRPRKDRERISNNPLDRDRSCYLCQLGKLEGFRSAEPGRNLEIVPTTTASRSESRDPEAGEDWQNGDGNTEMGVDMRWGISANSTLNATLNPDFSQVEADVAQLDVNTNFSLFYPERRPFFLDSADYFETFLPIVHTRNIGSPDYGVKFTSKADNNTTGVFVADDQQTNFVVPGVESSDIANYDSTSQNAVVRYRRDFGQGSTVGALVTSRSAEDYLNQVYGVDGKYRLNENDSLEAQLLASKSENPQQVQDDYELAATQSDTAGQLRYRHNSRNWSWKIAHQQFGKDFRSDLGFITQVGYQKSVAGLGHTWHGERDNWWNRIEMYGDWDITHDEDGRLLERELEGYVFLEGPLQLHVEFGGLTRVQDFAGELYDQQLLSLYSEFRPLPGLYFGAYTRVGDAIDYDNNRAGDMVQFDPKITWNIGRHLEARLRHNYRTLDVDGGRLFTANLTDLRLSYQFNNRSALRLTLQHADIERDLALYLDTEDLSQQNRSLGSQLLYSYKVNPQTVFFLGYSDQALDNDALDRMEKTDRSVFLKLSYAWLPD
ncbi:DUF5916 domain-containing protein [Microbulbifer sp. SAOS-129_SWC]|uniref:carbohydrate binding family 9 domain-containing protein n=1 Tax=Microbulbifer sp. SAOS-129_SWC TaxID=3145235 RepID=UPI003217EFC2